MDVKLTIFWVSYAMWALALELWMPVTWVDEFNKFPPPPSDSWFAIQETMNVIFWSGADPKVTLVFLPGGDGQQNIKYAVPKEFMWGIGSVASALADANQPQSRFNGVLFDRVMPLQGSGFNDWPGARPEVSTSIASSLLCFRAMSIEDQSSQMSPYQARTLLRVLSLSVMMASATRAPGGSPKAFSKSARMSRW